MKLKICTCIALTALVLSSCSKEKEPNTPTVAPEPVKEQTAEGMLSFDSRDGMLKTIQELSEMDDAKRAEWYGAKGNFESQKDFMWAVVNELDNAKSIEEVRDIQNRYSAVLLWNSNKADEDISPYLPSNEHGYSLVCNRNGEVLVAGEVCNFNTLKSFEETDHYKRLATAKLASSSSKGYTITEGINCLYVHNGKDRRFWAEGLVARFTTIPNYWLGAIDFTAQRKTILGWNHYKTSYTISYVSHSNWIAMSDFFNDLYNNRPSWDTPEFPAHSVVHLGRLNTGHSQPTTMTLNIYSRGVGPAGLGTFNYSMQLP